MSFSVTHDVLNSCSQASQPPSHLWLVSFGATCCMADRGATEKIRCGGSEYVHSHTLFCNPLCLNNCSQASQPPSHLWLVSFGATYCMADRVQQRKSDVVVVSMCTPIPFSVTYYEQLFTSCWIHCVAWHCYIVFRVCRILNYYQKPPDSMADEPQMNTQLQCP